MLTSVKVDFLSFDFFFLRLFVTIYFSLFTEFMRDAKDKTNMKI